MIKVTIFQVSLAFDSDGAIKVIKIFSKQTNLIYFLWDPGSHLCKKLNICVNHERSSGKQQRLFLFVILYANFDLVSNLIQCMAFCTTSVKLAQSFICNAFCSHQLQNPHVYSICSIYSIYSICYKSTFCENIWVKNYFCVIKNKKNVSGDFSYTGL